MKNVPVDTRTAPQSNSYLRAKTLFILPSVSMSHDLALVRWTSGLLLIAGLLGACSGPPQKQSPSSSSGTRVYHVQLQITEDKDQALKILDRGRQWWANQPASQRPPLGERPDASPSPLAIEWKAPYYRVRLGPFASKSQAETVLDAAHSAFPDAFVVPDRVDGQSVGDES